MELARPKVRHQDDHLTISLTYIYHKYQPNVGIYDIYHTWMVWEYTSSITNIYQQTETDLLQVE